MRCVLFVGYCLLSVDSSVRDCCVLLVVRYFVGLCRLFEPFCLLLGLRCCLVLGVFCLWFDVYRLVFLVVGACCSLLVVWRLVFVVVVFCWCLLVCVLRLAFGVLCLVFGVW